MVEESCAVVEKIVRKDVILERGLKPFFFTRYNTEENRPEGRNPRKGIETDSMLLQRRAFVLVRKDVILERGLKLPDLTLSGVA